MLSNYLDVVIGRYLGFDSSIIFIASLLVVLIFIILIKK